MGEHGIEHLKVIFRGLINFGETLDEKAADGKLSWMEILTSTISLVPEIFDAIKNGSEIYAELQDLDEVEMGELVAYIEAELDLRNDRTEEQIEAGAEFLAAFENFRKTFKKEDVV